MPHVLQQQILSELHAVCLGIVKMKLIGRLHVWWPKIDSDIETLAKSCHFGQREGKAHHSPSFIHGFAQSSQCSMFMWTLRDHSWVVLSS